MYIEIIGSHIEFFKDKKIILFGAGGRGKKVRYEFERIGAKVIAFCDNNPLLSGEYFDGVEVISPGSLKNYRDCEIIIASVYSKEIMGQLKELGITNSYQIRFGVAEKKLPPQDFTNKLYSSEEANQVIINGMESNQAFFLGRLGSVELECLCQYLAFTEKPDTGDYDRNIRYMMENNAGFFPSTSEMLDRFGDLYVECIKNMDMIWSMWFSEFEDKIYKVICPDTPVSSFDETSFPNTLAMPWIKSLAGKKVLVVHPFATSIEKNYKNREKLFADKEFLPEFELLTIKAVQSIASTKTEFEDWFEALDHMKKQMDKQEYDILLVGAGAYGLPLASHAKNMGKSAIHLGGVLQLFFGIKGKAYDKMNIYNSFWTSPLEEERPDNYKQVESGRYW